MTIRKRLNMFLGFAKHSAVARRAGSFLIKFSLQTTSQNGITFTSTAYFVDSKKRST